MTESWKKFSNFTSKESLHLLCIVCTYCKH